MTTTIDLTNYKTKRSAAMSIVKNFKESGSSNPVADAWDYVNANWQVEVLTPEIKIEEPKPIEKSTVDSTGSKSINERIRELHSAKFLPKEIYRLLTQEFGKPISYQRVKNTIKKIK